MKKTVGFVLVLLMVSTGLVSCKDDSDSNGGSVDLPVNADKLLVDLTADEATDVCVAIMTAASELMNSSDSFFCRSAGITEAIMAYYMMPDGLVDADLVKSCKDAEDSCLAEETEEFNAEQECTDAGLEDVGDCTATAGEMSDCVNAQLASGKASLDAASANLPSCDNMTLKWVIAAADSDEEEPEVQDPEMPSVCKPFFDKCPDLAGEMLF